MIFYNNFLLWITSDKNGYRWHGISDCQSVEFTSEPGPTEAAAIEAAKKYVGTFSQSKI